MTRAKLKALADALPGDILFSRAAGRAFLLMRDVLDTEGAVAFLIANGWWQERNQWGVSEVWRDTKTEWRATIQTAYVSRQIAVSTPPSLPPVATAHEVPRPAAKPRKTPPPLTGGLFG